MTRSPFTRLARAIGRRNRCHERHRARYDVVIGRLVAMANERIGER